MDAIHVNNLNFAYYREKILEDINLSVTSKDFLAIIGPNGGGKSTLIKLILGLLAPQSGTIKVYGKNPQDGAQSLAYVPQHTHINSDFPITVLEVVLMGCLDGRCWGRYTNQDRQKAHEALKQVGMSEYTNTKLSRLSGGQRQRVFIARALCMEAKMLLLDEPTASIDIDGQRQIFELLQSLNSKMGIIVVSHDINVVLGYANKIAHINRRLYMHDAPSSATKKAILTTLNNAQGHLCPVELIHAQTCNHPDHQGKS
jgi:zinc transport system ATP-binding protein